MINMSLDDELSRLIKRAEKNSIALGKSSALHGFKDDKYITFSNRRLKKSIIINKNDKSLLEKLGLL
jgi:hypothetical protein